MKAATYKKNRVMISVLCASGHLYTNYWTNVFQTQRVQPHDEDFTDQPEDKEHSEFPRNAQQYKNSWSRAVYKYAGMHCFENATTEFSRR